MTAFSRTAVIGAGTIGAGWSALFLASGRSLRVYDPSPDAEKALRDYVERAWPLMDKLGLTARGDIDAIRFVSTPEEAVEDADFIQENVPERLPVKHALFAAIEPRLAPHAIVASSASGLTLTQMQGGWQDPGRFILGHPFNPPHLIPLVELMSNARTAPGVIEEAEAFYADMGKVTIRLNKEVPGHVANRLQAAIWREAVHLVLSGVASVEDVDKAVTAGPGLRWSAMGPTTLFHLGAGETGLEGFLHHLQDTFNGWWEDLGQPMLDDTSAKALIDGMTEASHGQSVRTMAATRDARIVAVQSALRSVSETPEGD